MSKDVKYYSKDKLYKISKRKKLNLKKWFCFLLIPSVVLLLVSFLLFINSVQLNSKIVNVGYSETGNADYKVYLKENDYYDRKFLDSGMQYITNIISTINSKFNYEIHADENMDFDYKYKVTGELIISDPIDTSRILHTKAYNLLEEKEESINSNNLVINEDIDIDYDSYNKYVSSYKMDYGLAVDSKLIVTMDIKVSGNYKEKGEKLNKTKKLQISIPLNEQTININVLSDKINENGNLSSNMSTTIKNKLLFILAILVLLVSMVGIGLTVYLFLENRKKNIYNITVNKILKDYDRIIVNGNVELDENSFSNKIYPDTFQEMVDASQTLNSPILYYEVIKDEKCFFVIIKDDTMYKYRLTRAYLEKKEYESNMKKGI